MPSTVIASTRYDPAGKVLEIRFQSGAVYRYYDVPQEVYNEMKKAMSKGYFLNTRIKNNYSYEKIN
ncbi:KTSC domain-containing protein [Nostoc ellipsosporum NOK]|nr:KTSC domain-containing protein [Nostoc ellipsosporum NOK]